MSVNSQTDEEIFLTLLLTRLATSSGNATSLPCDQTLGSQLVGVAALGPSVGSVDWGVAVDVHAVLVGETVHTIALQLNTLVSIQPRIIKRYHKFITGELQRTQNK